MGAKVPHPASIAFERICHALVTNPNTCMQNPGILQDRADRKSNLHLCAALTMIREEGQKKYNFDY